MHHIRLPGLFIMLCCFCFAGMLYGHSVPPASEDDTVQIPDPLFLEALISNWVDVNDDQVISYAEAEAVHTLYVGFYDITDLTGIEAFTHLEFLYCAGNKLTRLDVSSCRSLSHLDCGLNMIQSLDLSSNDDLSILYCAWNELEELDVSRNAYLTLLDCGVNQLTMLDLSNNPSLRTLYCGWNQLDHLDVSTNDLLVFLDCTSNVLSELELSSNVFLDELYCGWNNLSILELGNNAELRILDCSSNHLVQLDLSGNRLLESIGLKFMASLSKICVWTMPFPPGHVEVLTEGSENVLFTMDCGDMEAPELTVLFSDLYRPGTIEITSSEDGFIYLVAEHTPRCLQDIRSCCLDSVYASAGVPVIMDVEGLSNGVYWLYARDLSVNLSSYREIVISGVGIDLSKEGDISVYPVPFRDLLHIQCVKDAQYSIEITASDGRIVYRKSFNGLMHQVDLSHCKGGIYFIRITAREFVFTRKLLKSE